MTLSSCSSLRFAVATLATIAMVAVCGCTLTGTEALTTPVTPATISGGVHGGQQPINNATVNLYAAGTTGYGSAGTLLATTTTNQAGQFQFTPMTANPGPGITSTWQCPTTTPASDPQIYITATGGNSSGSGATTPNSAIALTAALGNCSQISSSTFVIVNEMTTAATVYALAQYINPGSGVGAESIGTNGVNYTAVGTTPQGAVGLNNAVASIVNLANISSGVAVVSNTYTGTSSTANGVVVTATPNSAKLTTVADIIASCINTTSASSNNCMDLFNNAVPPPVAAVTSQPMNAFAPASDTIQAAYYLAVNPTNNSSSSFSSGSCNNNAAATSRGACLFGLSSATAPFQPGLSSTPNDWTIGVTYSSSSTCPAPVSAPFIAGPFGSAVDANGNLWFINADAPAGTALAASFAELSPIGVPLFCGGGSDGLTSPAYFTLGRGITIDPAGTVWASFGNQAKLEIVTPGSGTQASCATPLPPYGIVSDGNGNIFLSDDASTNPLYVFPSGSTNTALCNGTTHTQWVTAGYTPSNTTASPYLAADGLGRIWFGQPTTANQALILYPQTVPITGYSVTGAVATFTAANTFAVGQTVTVTGLTTAEGLALDHQNYLITAATGTSFSAATTAATIAQTADAGTAFVAVPAASGYTADSAFSLAGTSYGIAIDNSNYGYFGSTCCAAPSGTSSPTDEEFNKVTAPSVSTSAPTKASSAGASSPYVPYFAGSTGARSLAVDGAGNIWFGMLYPEVGGITATSGTSTSDTYAVGEFTASGSGTSVTFTPLSPPGSSPSVCSSSNNPPECPVGGGFQDPNFLASYGIAVDPSGNVWVPNGGGQVATGSTTSATYYYGTSITELVGAGVPVVTPTALGLKNGTQGTKP